MDKQFKVYYVPDFPIKCITNGGEEGWYTDPDHSRNRYRFLEAIVEHINNTYCEPIQIIMRDDGTVAAGPSGVTRLYALRTISKKQTIPAIVSTEVIPEWLDITNPVESLQQLRSYYRLEPADIGFENNGRAFHRNHNPNPQQVNETFVVSEETKKRVITMLEEQSRR